MARDNRLGKVVVFSVHTHELDSSRPGKRASPVHSDVHADVEPWVHDHYANADLVTEHWPVAGIVAFPRRGGGRTYLKTSGSTHFARGVERFEGVPPIYLGYVDARQAMYGWSVFDFGALGNDQPMVRVDPSDIWGAPTPEASPTNKPEAKHAAHESAIADSSDLLRNLEMHVVKAVQADRDAGAVTQVACTMAEPVEIGEQPRPVCEIWTSLSLADARDLRRRIARIIEEFETTREIPPFTVTIVMHWSVG